MLITEKEYEKLLKLAGGRSLTCHKGMSAITLFYIPQNQWAFDLLNKGLP